MKRIIGVAISCTLAACSWGPKTISTKDYNISDIKPPDSVEELRVYTQMADKCPADSLNREVAVPLGAMLLGSAVKQVAAYGKEQVDIAIKYLQSDVKISGKSFISTASMAPVNPGSPPPKLCILAVYGKFGDSKPEDTLNTLTEIFRVSKAAGSRIDKKFERTLENYKISGDKSPRPVDGLIGKPAFMLEMSAMVVAGTNATQKKFLYRVEPTYLWYPHALHKSVFDRAKRNLTVETDFADVKNIIPLDGFTAGHVYVADDFASRFSLTEGVKSSSVNVVTISVTEGPDKVPTDRALNIISDAIKAKTDELSARIAEKAKENTDEK